MKLLLVAGARPNFMKIAPLIHAIQRHNAEFLLSALSSQLSKAPSSPDPISAFQNVCVSALETPTPISYRLVHTGQHYDAKMSDIFFAELGIPKPDINLEVGSGSHAVQTANIMTRFEPVLLNAFSEQPGASGPSSVVRSPSSVVSGPISAFQDFSVSAFEKSSVLCPPSSALPDWVVVVGDVNSTMACTIVAAKAGVRVAHVEAGLRSYDRTMPEEINRVVTDALADLLLTPSEDANENLKREGVAEAKIRVVGNIMIDSLVANLRTARARAILQQLDLKPGGFVYVTLHRPSNVDQRESLGRIMQELERLATRLPVVLPIHPRMRKMLHDFGISWNGAPGLKVLEPIGYHDSLCLTEQARLVLTDSGGLQEESTYFRTPCLTLRPNTERPVTVTMGSNRLTALPTLSADLAERLAGPARCGSVPALWDGHTADRILETLLCAKAES